MNLDQYGIFPKQEIIRNASPSQLYKYAILFEEEAEITNLGALAIKSGNKTGRSPKDKRIIARPESENDIWWGDVNIKMEEHIFDVNKQRAIDYFNTRSRIYVVDGYAGWDKTYQIKIRVICTRPYHALFMHNMLIRPTPSELLSFENPDYVIYNAGEFPSNIFTSYMNRRTSIDLCFEKKEFVILGTEYAGEMKKGVFTIMNYIMPKQGILSMHCSANQGINQDVSLFFGLSGTGKTTLSADAERELIGDDEHCWSADGVFNIEGGCYAKAVDLSAEKEPEIFNAIKFGTILENVILNHENEVDYSDTSITENTRAAYPIEFINHAKIPCMGGHPKNIIFLTCDAFGVLPPVSKLNPEQAMYHFISGYTAKIAGTEMGITEPSATFSSCFGAAFLVWHPSVYSELLAQKIKENNTHVWLINTGWIGGSYGTGQRIKLKYTRAIIDAIHSEKLNSVNYSNNNLFGLNIPETCPNLPDEILNPEFNWADRAAYTSTAEKLSELFKQNFKKFEDGCSKEVKNAGPK